MYVTLDIFLIDVMQSRSATILIYFQCSLFQLQKKKVTNSPGRGFLTRSAKAVNKG